MEFIWHKSFKKDWKKHSQKNKKKYIERLKLLENDIYHPLLNYHKLNGKFVDCLSVNITSDLRIIFRVKDNIITLIRFATHAELYN